MSNPSRRSRHPTPALILGTRPEIIKLAPLADALTSHHIPFTLIHTGQHYSYEMSQIFLEELGLHAKPSFLNIGGGSQSEQIATALTGLEKLLAKNPPSCLIVEGDTNTVLAGALSGIKLNIPVVHVEAGLRSYDLRMPEEHNRRVTDHISTILFATTKHNAQTLKKERVHGKISVTGNTIIDACIHNLPIALQRSEILHEFPLEPGKYALATMHRVENVDDPRILANFIRIFEGCPQPVVLPLHPRTVKMARRFGLWRRLSTAKNLRITGPVGYWDFLILEKNASFFLTDSGGIQEEATAPNIRKMCFVLRTSTEREEAVKAGFARLVGIEPGKVLKMVRRWWDKGAVVPRRKSPFGDGHSAERMTRILRREGFC